MAVAGIGTRCVVEGAVIAAAGIEIFDEGGLEVVERQAEQLTANECAADLR